MSVVAITGAAGGLGWELTRRFHARGDQLYLVDRDGEALQERVGSLAARERVTTHQADLTDSDAIAAIADGVRGRFGCLDVLVNNAGITHRSLAVKTDPAVLKQVMAVDWQAPVELALALMPQLRESRGSIVNIGSMAGWMPVLGRAGYCSAKSALAQFFEVLRAEEADSGLHVLMVYPSFLDTPIEENALGHDGRPAGHARSTIGRIGNPGSVADGVLRALEKRRPAFYPNRFTWFASLLWRVAPQTFLRLSRRRFAVELEQR